MRNLTVGGLSLLLFACAQSDVTGEPEVVLPPQAQTPDAIAKRSLPSSSSQTPVPQQVVRTPASQVPSDDNDSLSSEIVVESIEFPPVENAEPGPIEALVGSLRNRSLITGSQPLVPPVPSDPPAESVASLSTGSSPEFPPIALEKGESLTVALLLPLGAEDRELAADAEDLRDAAQMGLFDWKNDRVSLILLDTGGTPQGAAEAAYEALERGARVILGPLLRDSVTAVAAVVEYVSVPVLAFSNDMMVADNGVYVLGLSPYFEVRRVVGAALSSGLSRFAILVPDNPYGQVVLSAAQRETILQGGEITHLAFYNPTDRDFSEHIKNFVDYENRHQALLDRVEELETMLDGVDGETNRAKKVIKKKPAASSQNTKNDIYREFDETLRAELETELAQLKNRETYGPLDFDAVLLAASDGGTLRILASQLAQFEADAPDVRYLGLSLWEDFGDLSREPSLYGAWYAAPPNSGWAEFARRFEEYYGRWPRSIATLSYEGVGLSTLLVGSGRRDGTGLEALSNLRGFRGVRGIFRLTPSGIAERRLAVKEITEQGVRIVSPAASSFQ